MNESNEIKQCPYCGEDIHINAVKCPYCRTWLVEKPDENHVPVSPNTSKPTIASTQDGLERFLDKAADKVTNFNLLKWLCLAGVILALYDCITMRVDVDTYYRSGFMRGIVWIEKNLHWLISLFEGAVEIGILLALRKILIKYGIKSWISLCIVIGAAWYIFDAIASGTIISGILGLACGILSIEYGYKMSRSEISNIKYVGYLEIFASAFMLALLFVLPLLLLIFASSYNTGEKELKWFSIISFIVSVELYELLYKLFKKEYSEKK